MNFYDINFELGKTYQKLKNLFEESKRKIENILSNNIKISRFEKQDMYEEYCYLKGEVNGILNILYLVSRSENLDNEEDSIIFEPISNFESLEIEMHNYKIFEKIDKIEVNKNEN